jgi:DnaK suppressor protein
MANKKMTKRGSKKSVKKNIVSIAKKTTRKTKPKIKETRKAAPQRSVTKKTTVKTKPPRKRKTSKRPVVKRIPLKKIAKTTEKTRTTTKRPGLKRAAAKTSEDGRNATMRRALIKRREEIVKEAKAEISKYIRGETKQLVDTALDDGDWSIIDLSEDISLKQLSTHRETLLKIDESLRKLNEGTYGKCEDCGEDISAERLRVLPFAIYCRECQEKREQIEEMDRKEGMVG